MKTQWIELILNLRNCSPEKQSIHYLLDYIKKICKIIEIEKHGEPLVWDDEGTLERPGGISLLQFLKASNIAIHTIKDENIVFINLFSCKPFNQKEAEDFSKKFFEAKELNSRLLIR